MDGAGGETGGETEQKGGKGARCRKQVGRGGREGVEHESTWETSRIGEHGVLVQSVAGGGTPVMGAVGERSGERSLGRVLSVNR